MSKIGVIHCLLPAHQDAEISFFAQFTKARAHAIPSQFKKFSHQELSRRVRAKEPSLQFTFVSGDNVDSDFISITQLLKDRIEDRVPLETLKKYRPDPLELGVFSCPAGQPGFEGHPRTHNDYAASYKRSRDCELLPTPSWVLPSR
jgi:2,3-dihydroxybenzoate-AMP ligase/mycobactin salicyl-AMP ligase